MSRLAPAALLCILALPAAGQPSTAPITPDECRILEESYSTTIPILRRHLEAYRRMVDGLKAVTGRMSERPGLLAAAEGLIATSATAEQAAALERMEDLVYQLRVCARR